MTVDTIMSRDVEVVAPDVTLMEIQDVLRQRGFRHLLVMDDDTLIGIISDRDVLRALSPFLDTLSETPRDVKTLTRTAREMMRNDPLCVAPDTDVKEAARVLLEHTISSLPVRTDDGTVVGIITSNDLLRYMVDVDE